MAAPRPPRSAWGTISGSYIQTQTCPSTVSVVELNLSSTTFQPGNQYSGNVVLSTPTPPFKPTTINCELVMTYIADNIAKPMTLATLTAPWPIGTSSINIPFSFTMPDLNLTVGSTYSVMVSIYCTVDCSEKIQKLV